MESMFGSDLGKKQGMGHQSWGVWYGKLWMEELVQKRMKGNAGRMDGA